MNLVKRHKVWEYGTYKIIRARDVEIIENMPKQTAIIIEHEDSDSSVQNETKKEIFQDTELRY